MDEVQYLRSLRTLKAYERAGQSFYKQHGYQIDIPHFLHHTQPADRTALLTQFAKDYSLQTIEYFLSLSPEELLGEFLPKYYVTQPRTVTVQQLMRYIKVAPHKHEFFELVFVLTGTCTHVVGDNSFEHVPGDFTIIPPGITHYLEASGESVCLTVKATADTFERLFFDILRNNTLLSAYLDRSLRQPWFQCAVTLHAGNDEQFQRMLLSIFWQQEENLPYSGIIIESSFQVLLAYLMQNYENTAEYLVSDNVRQKQIVEVMQYAYRNHKTTTLEQVADHFHYNPSYLSARIRELTGHTFSSLLKDYKMGIVQHLLVNTDLPVYEICQQVGYQNPSQFVRTFRKKFGMTPIQYRNRERNKQETINI
ncbi:MAG: helix-turn-helix domain-containing protein [Oscillospiraceae bacterium]|nr:helix-turn-helix domain-containing protein [Oscillospiraceae bacterium]